jgi:hypothetical protein
LGSHFKTITIEHFLSRTARAISASRCLDLTELIILLPFFECFSDLSSSFIRMGWGSDDSVHINSSKSKIWQHSIVYGYHIYKRQFVPNGGWRHISPKGADSQKLICTHIIHNHGVGRRQRGLPSREFGMAFVSTKALYS